MMNRFKLLGAIPSLLLCAAAGFAAGPSRIAVEIEPFASREDGMVLFRSSRVGNASGAQTPLAVSASYQWICASADGRWEQAEFAAVAWGDSEFPEGTPWAKKEEFQLRRLREAKRRFESEQDLAAPGPALESFLQVCGGGLFERLDPDLGKGQAVWSPTRFCVDGGCVNERVPQRTLGALSGAEGHGVVESKFFFAGLAVFRNEESSRGASVGAVFPLENPMCDNCLFDSARIDGIAIVPRDALPIPPTSSDAPLAERNRFSTFEQ